MLGLEGYTYETVSILLVDIVTGTLVDVGVKDKGRVWGVTFF
jgi:hypothetical protein